jgi:hypothetical protein
MGGSQRCGSKTLFNTVGAPVMPKRPRYKSGNHQYREFYDERRADMVECEQKPVTTRHLICIG